MWPFRQACAFFWHLFYQGVALTHSTKYLKCIALLQYPISFKRVKSLPWAHYFIRCKRCQSCLIVIAYLIKILLLGGLYHFTFSAIARPVSSVMINNCETLLAIPEKSTLHYQLTQDIDCTDQVVHQPKVFSGVLEGQHHAIRHLTLQVRQGAYVGLFSRLEGATIKHLTLDNIQWQTGESLVQMGGLLAGIIKFSHIEDLRITQSNLAAGDAAYYPFAQMGLGLVAGIIERSTLTQIQLENNQITTSSSSGAVGALAGRAHKKAQIKNVLIHDLSIQVHIGLRVRRKHYIGGVLGYLGDASELSDVQITHTYIDDAQQGDHVAGIGHIAGYLRPYAQIHRATLADNHYEFIPMRNDKTAFLVGKSLLHSHISDVCMISSRPDMSLKHGKGLLTHILFDSSCSHTSTSKEPSFHNNEENKFSIKS
tara:strand:- start:3607 stop:4881 length:1275 start_codon:yes stop_codon:yes gene_type:complete